MAVTPEQHEKWIEEWLAESKKMLGGEVYESGSIPGKEPPFPSFVCDEKVVKDAAASIGDDNPLFTDPAYAAKTRYGCLTLPPTIFIRVRYTPSHGVPDRHSILAPFFAGTMFEWYDSIPLGTRFRTSLRLRELLEKKGRKGRLLILVTEGFYWNQRGDLLGKARGHLIEIPMVRGRDESMGEQMLYERPLAPMPKEDIEKFKKALDSEERCGAEPRYWEDVNIDDVLTPTVMGPFSLQDQMGFNEIWGEPNPGPDWVAAYKRRRKNNARYVHPVTHWPWSPATEHQDPMLCRYRGLPGPFDFGAHRVGKPGHMLTNWMGDDGFLKKMYIEIRKPKYYGDTTMQCGKVIGKYKVKETGEAGMGGAPGEAEYAAVDIQITQVNQVGEDSAPGRATIYLPSRELGPVKLPIPHLPRPPSSTLYKEATPEYIPFPSYSKEAEVRVAVRGHV